MVTALKCQVEPATLASPVALFSLDVETDYGTGRGEALAQLDRFVELMRELDVPWTAFVEGHFFKKRRDVCRLLRDAGVDLQIHCYDHCRGGDTPTSLRSSAARYADFCGHCAEGYRADTYRLTEPLFDALVESGFLWDSSLMRAFGQGRTTERRFRRGDYLLLGGRLVEFPIATWRGLRLPLNHPHLLLAKTAGRLALRTVCRPSRLLTYNFHMTDLVRCDSLRVAKRGTAVRLLHKYLWSLQGPDTFPVARSFIQHVRRCGYELMTTTALYQRVRRESTVPARIAAPARAAQPFPSGF